MKVQFNDLIKKTNAVINYMEKNKIRMTTNREINKIPPTGSKKKEIHQKAIKNYYNLIRGVQSLIQKTNVNTGVELSELLMDIRAMIVNQMNNKKLKEIESPNNYEKLIKKYLEYIKKLRDGLVPKIYLFSSMSKSVNNIKKLKSTFNSKNLKVIPVPQNTKKPMEIFGSIFIDKDNIQTKCFDIVFIGPTGGGKTYISKMFYEFVTGQAVNKKIGGVLRSQYVTAYYPRFDFVQTKRGENARIKITECVDTRNKRELTYDVYEKKYIKPTVYNEESSRAHLMYSLPPMKGMKTIMGNVPGKMFNIFDLCGMEDPEEMSKRAFGFSIYEMLNTDLFFMHSLLPSGAASSISTLMQYLQKPPKQRVTYGEKRIVQNIIRFLDSSKDKAHESLKNLYKSTTREIETVADLVVFCIVARTMQDIKTGNMNTQNANAKAYKLAFFSEIQKNPNTKVKSVKNELLKKLFLNHNNALKEYTIGNYMIQMFSRCLESIYIKHSLYSIRKSFKPNIKNNLTVINKVNVNATTGLIPKFLNSRKQSEKYLFGVVNPTVTNGDIKKYHVKMINNFENMMK